MVCFWPSCFQVQVYVWVCVYVSDRENECKLDRETEPCQLPLMVCWPVEKGSMHFYRTFSSHFSPSIAKLSILFHGSSFIVHFKNLVNVRDSTVRAKTYMTALCVCLCVCVQQFLLSFFFSRLSFASILVLLVFQHVRWC